MVRSAPDNPSRTYWHVRHPLNERARPNFVACLCARRCTVADCTRCPKIHSWLCASLARSAV